ncbi:MAG: hypothetical protein ACLUNQ_05155 [Oscillospiraceae bacterium]
MVTSPAGAAVHDMIRILRRRFPRPRSCFFRSVCRGRRLPGKLPMPLPSRKPLSPGRCPHRRAGAAASVEDSGAFNEEVVARAIFDSRILASPP